MQYYDKARSIQEVIGGLKERIAWEQDGDEIAELAFRINAFLSLTTNIDELAESYPQLRLIEVEASDIERLDVRDEQQSLQRIQALVASLDKEVQTAIRSRSSTS